MIIYIPNILTLARIASVPLLIVLLQEQNFLMSLIVFIAAGITDGLDGYIAKKYDAKTKLGGILDPLADKALLVSSYVMLSFMELIPFWLMVVVVFRDVLIISGYLVMEMFFGSITVQPLKISKINTFLQITYIVLILAALAWQLEISTVLLVVAYLVFMTSILSGAQYAYIWSKRATQSD